MEPLRQSIGLIVRSKSTRLTAVGCAALLAAGTAAGCGSDSSSSNVEPSGGSPAKEITPDAKNPESADSNNKKAPDDVISERPGGPGDRPTQP